MDGKAILAFLLDPKLLAAAGGAASYYFIGRGKQGPRPYLFAAGGVVAGYMLGKVISPFVAGPKAVQAATAQNFVAPATLHGGLEEYVDLDAQATAPLALPPHEEPRSQAPAPARPATPPAPQPPSRRKQKPARTPVPDIMDSMGSFAGVGEGEDELGSYGTSFGDIDGDIDDALRSRGRN